MINLLRWCVRIAGLAALVLGLTRFTGAAHVTLGAIVAAALAIVAAAALSARVRMPVAGIGVVWAAATVYVGAMQRQWMGGSTHWIIQTAHVLLGVGAIGLAEMLGGAIARQRA